MSESTAALLFKLFQTCEPLPYEEVYELMPFVTQVNSYTQNHRYSDEYSQIVDMHITRVEPSETHCKLFDSEGRHIECDHPKMCKIRAKWFIHKDYLISKWDGLGPAMYSFYQFIPPIEIEEAIIRHDIGL